MRYGSTTKATHFPPPDWRIKLTKVVFCFIPAANPDSERLFPEVKQWFLEVDDDGSSLREVAVDAEARPLFRSPEGRNTGFWTDSDAKFTDADLAPASEQEFEALWAKAGPE